MRVLRYELGPGESALNLPDGAVVLAVAMRPHTTCVMLFVRITQEVVTRQRRFIVVGTSVVLPPDGYLRYLGTALPPSGSFEWHVFERFIEPPE